MGISGIHGKSRVKPRSQAGARRAPPARVRAPAPAVVTPADLSARVGWREAIGATVAGLGYELVDVERGQRGLLRVTIDRVPGRTYLPRAAADDAVDVGAADTGEFITVDDCEKVTRQLQYVLEVEGLDYARLEVSSPGLDRPLRREADLERFAGQAVVVQLKLPFEGRKSWQGVLRRAVDGGWQLEIKDGKDEQVFGFVWDEVREARLVPVVDFKGRKSLRGGPAGAAADEQAAPGADGG